MAEHVIKNGQDIDDVTPQLTFGDTVIVEPGNYGGVYVKVAGVTYRAKERRTAKTGQWYFATGANDVTIEGFVVTTGNQGGAFILNRSNKNNLIKDCEMYECGSIGVDVTGGSDYNIITDCDIHDCHYAFHTSGGGCYGNIFQKNHCYNHSDGINVSPSAYDTKILNNVIHDCEDDGIHLFDEGQAEVIGNLVYNCKGVPLWVHGKNGIITKNNTVIGLAPKDSAKNVIVWIEWGGHIFKNNILYTEHPDMKLIRVDGGGDIDYNCMYKKDVAGVPYGANGIYADPKFVDVANDDYRLQADSPCIGMGYDMKPVEPIPEPELAPEPEPPIPQPEYVEKTILIEALRGMLDKIKGE